MEVTTLPLSKNAKLNSYENLLQSHAQSFYTYRAVGCPGNHWYPHVDCFAQPDALDFQNPQPRSPTSIDSSPEAPKKLSPDAR